MPRFYNKLANLFLSDPTTLPQNLKELVSTYSTFNHTTPLIFLKIYRIPIPVSAHASFFPNRDPQAPPPPTKDGKALLARVAFLLKVIEPLAPLVDQEYQLIFI